MKAESLSLIRVLFLLAGVSCLPSSPAKADAEQPTISVVTDPSPGPASTHGVKKVLSALREKGFACERVNSLNNAGGKILIVVGRAHGSGPASTLLAASRQPLPEGPEALTIRKIDYKGKPTWVIGGSDDRGLMYGELDVADRIGWSNDKEAPLSEVHNTLEKPSASTRAVSLFTMNRAYWESRFYDEAYWARYLDTLAQNRFNSLVVIFGYENGGFMAPCYPYFFDVEGFPDVRMVGITPEQQKRNLQALNRLIQMAHERGIEFTAGIWDHIYRSGVQGGGAPGAKDAATKPTYSVVQGVTSENLVPYTRAALAKFVKQFPVIDGIQFRMHDESGLKREEQEGFWRDIFAMVKATAPNLRLDLRAKGLPDSVIQTAVSVGVKFRITTKYWMEQMGLPFHPTHINPQDQQQRRHGYADMLRYPQQYKMHWRLWSGGSLRILLWGDPEYARRFVESTHLYDGDGFEINEPLATKMEAQPHDKEPFDLLKPSARYYDYEFERYWHYFQVFGRIGYNVAAPAEIWDRAFEKRFGKEAAPSVEKALHQASGVLPRIVASTYLYSRFPLTDGWAEKQSFGNLPTFAKAGGTDVQLFASFDEEAKMLIDGGETAKVRPQQNSRWFADAAREIEAQIAEAEKRIGADRNKEFDSTIVDLHILSNLALYYARRIPAGVSYALFERTQDPSALDEAIKYERSAVQAWKQIVDAAGDVYASDLMMGARSRNLCGHWRDELTKLEQGLAALEKQRAGLPATPVAKSAPLPHAADGNAEKPVVIHQPITTALPGKALPINAQVKASTGIKTVRLLYRSVNQTLDYQTLPMQADGKGNYQAVIPAENVNPKWDLMYLIEAIDNTGTGVIYPDFNKEAPYIVVRLQRSASLPAKAVR